MPGCWQDYVYVMTDKRKMGIEFLAGSKCRLQTFNRAFFYDQSEEDV